MIEEKGHDCPPKSLAERRRRLDGSVQGPAPGTRSISAAVHAEAERGIGWGREALWLLGGQQPEDQPRGFLRAGSWVTARATESRPRSQVYLRRHRWAGIRQVGPQHPRGRRMVPQLEGKVLPCTHAFPAGTRRLSSGARLRFWSPIVTTEEPSWERGAGEREWRPLGLNTCLGVPESALAGRPWEPFQVLGIQGPAAAWSPGARRCHPPYPPSGAPLANCHSHTSTSCLGPLLLPCPWTITWHEATHIFLVLLPHTGDGLEPAPQSGPTAPGTALSSCLESRPGLGEEGCQAEGLPTASTRKSAAYLLSRITPACPSHIRVHIGFLSCPSPQLLTWMKA